MLTADVHEGPQAGMSRVRSELQCNMRINADHAFDQFACLTGGANPATAFEIER